VLAQQLIYLQRTTQSICHQKCANYSC